MQDKKEYIAEKMKILLGKEGYSKPQAFFIANEYYNKKMQQGGKEEYYQMGGFNIDPTMFYPPNVNLEAQAMSPQQDFSNYYIPPPVNNTLPQNYDFSVSGLDTSVNMVDSTKQSPVIPPNYYDTNRVNILNPYGGGIGLESALNFAGQGFGSKNAGQATLGSLTSLLKGSRNFLSGYSIGKENLRVQDEYLDNRFVDNRNFVYGQQGGKIKNSNVIAKNAIIDNPQGQVNLEGGEFVMRNNGMVQPVIGDKHIENGKKSDGVNAELNDGDKVLSNYMKLKPSDIKDLKERYDISLKRGTTFAEAQKKLDQKLGIKKLESEKADILEKIEKANKIKNEDTKNLSLQTLFKKTGEVSEKLNTLSGVRANNFEFLFQRQEKQPKKGDGTQLFDKNGKEVTEENKPVGQQGLKMDLDNPNISDEYGRTLSSERVPVYKIGDVEYEVSRLGALHPKGSLTPTVFGAVSKNAPLLKAKTEEQAILEVGQNKLDPTRTARNLFQLNRGWILDEKGNRVKRVDIPDYEQIYGNMQQVGIMELAKKHNISPERAQELISMQQGGEQDQMQEIFQGVGEMLQQGEDPNVVIEFLIKQGAGHEEAMQIVSEISQQIQGQAPQEEQIPQQEYAQQGYTFSTKYTPNLQDYDVEGSSIVDLDRLQNVEQIQPYTGKGYGEKMADVQKTIDTHSWYFDTPEKKMEFIEASTKEGKQPEIEKFQKAYNEEIAKRAKNAGLPESEIKKVIEDVGFTGAGVQDFDGKFGAFTSTRPLFNFSKKDGEIVTEVEKSPVIPQQEEVIARTNVKNIMPNFGSYIPLFSPMQPISREAISMARLDPIKMTPEPMLAEQERQRLTDAERVEQTGMSPQQQEAVLAQNLASSQMASNDAISKVEQWNAQNQNQVDVYNAGAQTKEDIMNAQFRQDYQNKALQTIANQEESVRNQYRTAFLQDVANQNKIIDMNRINLLSDQFALTPTGIEVLNNRPYEIKTNYLSQYVIDKMTPEEYNAYKKQMVLKSNN